MEQPSVGQGAPYKKGMPDRRQNKPDIWAKIFRYVTLLVYPVLVICLFAFLSLADAQQRKHQLMQIDQSAATAEAAGGAGMHSLLPILAAGLAIGIAGLVLGRIRARRRSDYNFQTQLILVILSAGALLIYFILAQQGII